MWVIVAKKGLEVHRDELISEILEVEKTKVEEYYLLKSTSSYRYNVTQYLAGAKIYKHRHYCEKLVNRFKIAQKEMHRNPFHWIKDYHLSYREVTTEEWNRMCDQELNRLERNYQYQKQRIEEKRNSFK